MKHQNIDRLSWGDSVFLNLEREGMPLNVASVSVLEGDIAFEDYVRFVESRLPRIPRYLKRLVTSPLHLDLPVLDFDPAFDIRNHVKEVRLKKGSDAELKALAGEIFGKVMDRQLPLWDLTLVRGLKGNRTGLIARMHHCLADGIAGVGVMNILMDASPEIPALSPRKRFRVPRPAKTGPDFVEGLAKSYSNFMECILAAWGGVLDLAGKSFANGDSKTSSNSEFSRLMPEIAAPTERLRFNALYRGPQKYACAEISLADIRAIRHAHGTSVNDVLLALVTATIRRYSDLHGDRVKGRFLRIMVPVNLRSGDTSHELGNRISLIAVTIPLGIRDPLKLLAAVHRRTEFLKHAHAAELVGLAGGLLSILPVPVQSFAGSILSQVPVAPFNMVCTNVPGPQFPLYVLGHKMLHWYPYVPVGGELTLNCAILSYNGMVYFGFSGDTHITPDLARLEKFLKASFAELRAAVRVKMPTRKKRTEHKRNRSRRAASPREALPSIEVPVPKEPPLISLPNARPVVSVREPSSGIAQHEHSAGKVANY